MEKEVKKNQNRHSHCKARCSFPSKSWVGQTPSIIVIRLHFKTAKIFPGSHLQHHLCIVCRTYPTPRTTTRELNPAPPMITSWKESSLWTSLCLGPLWAHHPHGWRWVLLSSCNLPCPWLGAASFADAWTDVDFSMFPGSCGTEMKTFRVVAGCLEGLRLEVAWTVWSLWRDWAILTSSRPLPLDLHGICSCASLLSRCQLKLQDHSEL